MVDLSHSPTRLLPRLAGLTAVVLALIATVLSPKAAASAHCRYAHTAITAASHAQMDSAVVCLINHERTSRHLPALQASWRLNKSAQGWTNSMVRHRDFSHGSNFAARITSVGFNWSQVGENIAGGYQTPADAVSAWMASPGHCQNILSPLYRYVGTGVSAGAAFAPNAPGTWTQDFGLLMGQHAPSSNYGPANGCPYN